MPPYSGPSRELRAIPRFDPLAYAIDEERAARSQTPSGPPLRFDTSLIDQDSRRQSEDDRFEMEVATTPGMRSLADPTGDVGSSPDSWAAAALQPKTFRRGGIGGRSYQFDPRVALGTELARARSERQTVAADAPQMADAKLAEDDARVRRLVQSGYSPREAARQVHGGPRTVAEDQALIQTRSADQLARDKFIQENITSRQQAESVARQNLQLLLERSRGGDRNATLELRRAQILLNQANREYTEATRAQMMNAIGVDATPPGAGADDLNAAVEEHLGKVGSIEKGRAAAVDGVRTAGAAAPVAGAPVLPDDDIERVISGAPAPRAPAPVGASSVAPAPAAPAAPAKRPPSAKLSTWAKGDPGKKEYLASQGYDVSRIP